jgi:hypothetical protein
MSDVPASGPIGARMRPIQQSVGSQTRPVLRSMGTPDQAVRLSPGSKKQPGRRGVALVEGVRLSEERLNAGNRGVESVGNALANTGQLMMNMALRRQEFEDKGRLADEDNRRMEVVGGIQKYVAENPDRPETWGQIREAAWKQYEKDRAARRQKEGWNARAIEIDERNYQEYRTRIDTQFGVDEVKGTIRKANAKLQANGENKLRQGDYAGFMAAIDSMSLFPDQREAMIRDGLESGMYKTAINELDALRNVPAGKVVPILEQYRAELLAKDEKTGVFLKYEFPRGGLSLGGRVNIQSIVEARIREAQHAMDVKGRNLVTAIRAGRATDADVMAAVESGEIDRITARDIAPDVVLAQEVAQDRVDRRRAADEAKKLNQAQQQAAKVDSLRKKALEAGEIGLREIDRQIGLGEITAEQGDQLKAELGQAARREQETEDSDYDIISRNIHGKYAKKLFGLLPGQAKDAEYRKIQAQINTAKLTKESRLKLVGELFDLKLADMEDLEEEGPANGSWLDREISPTERALRRTMIGEYRKLLPALGDTLAGDLLFNQEPKIRAFFDTAEKGRSQQEIEKFLKTDLLPEVHKAAGLEALRDAFQF